eukprot:GHUV01035293.1.p1 GENE.GHUV01035293.1~~GHUV01035293.1.p1  ORF type:complete len:158 (+),score=28.70 GHUV01035293.1:265-738(+)
MMPCSCDCSYLGMYTALQLTPVISLIGAVAVTLWPSPAMVAAFEVMRKLIGYAVNRPAREVLFTVVSRDEKYRAKLVIDTVVQRLGDAVAAAAFQVLGECNRLHLWRRAPAKPSGNNSFPCWHSPTSPGASCCDWHFETQLAISLLKYATPVYIQGK